jgi:hypothetical protein
MTPDEVIDLLSICAGYDRRTVGEVDVESWIRALDDPRIPNIGYDECVDAVITHYRETADFVMPAHILTRVKAERASVISRALPAARPEPGAYAAAGALWRKRFAETQQRMKQQKAAVLAIPELAQRLTEPPLGFAKPEQWNGGIPPETFNGERNDSARRDALLALVEEAGQQAAITRKEDQ